MSPIGTFFFVFLIFLLGWFMFYLFDKGSNSIGVSPWWFYGIFFLFVVGLLIGWEVDYHKNKPTKPLTE